MTVRLVTPTGIRPHDAKVVNSGVASLVNGAVIDTDGDALVAAVADRPGGIMVDAIPTDNPPRFYRLAVSGDVIHDDALTSQTEGAIIWSDGDGTYSVTKPTAGAADTLRWMLGYIMSSDALGTYIRLDIQVNTDGAT
jgi:hypothetical protein